MSGAAAYLILAAELIAGMSVLAAHEVRHHGLAARFAAAARSGGTPPLTPHAAWERARLSAAQRRAACAAAAVIEIALGWAWVTGHRVPVLIAYGAAVLVIATGQPLAVRASRRP